MRYELTKEMIYAGALFTEFLVGSYRIELSWPQDDPRQGRTGAMLTLTGKALVEKLEAAGVDADLVEHASMMVFFNTALMRAVEMIAHDGSYAVPDDKETREGAGALARVFMEQYTRSCHGPLATEEKLKEAVASGDTAMLYVIERSEEVVANVTKVSPRKPTEN